ncbi:MAG: hypothetical protein SFV18_11615 [Bryobacteraceae bacterium]|nr:hypothetical protein [Bryobacteraceae bacterium]
MRKYRDFPMDFADATLVHTANRERISTVFTTDYSDFSAYRLSANRPFEIVPPR